MEKEIERIISNIIPVYPSEKRGEPYWQERWSNIQQAISDLAALFEREMAAKNRDHEEVTANLAARFEGQLAAMKQEMETRDGGVLWEGKALIAHYAHKQPQTDFHDVDLVFHFWVPGIVIGMEGQLVDVIVKASENRENTPENAKAQESAE